jgi:hypothetical protein
MGLMLASGLGRRIFKMTVAKDDPLIGYRMQVSCILALTVQLK